MTKRTKGKILKWIALLLFDVGVPLGFAFALFPVWVEKSAEKTISGIFLVFALICVIPVFKWLSKHAWTPSSWILWVILFVLFAGLRAIIDDMVLICLAGAVSNLIGSLLYKIGEKLENENA